MEIIEIKFCSYQIEALKLILYLSVFGLFLVRPGFLMGYDGVVRGCMGVNLTGSSLTLPTGWITFTQSVANTGLDPSKLHHPSGVVHLCATNNCNDLAVPSGERKSQGNLLLCLLLFIILF